MSGMADNGVPPGEGPAKTAKQLKKEAQKREKMEKFLSKQNKKVEDKKNAKVN